MNIYVVREYKARFPALRGHDLTDALIRQLLAEGGFLVRAAADQLQITRLAGGKPVVPEYPGLHVSVSHTGDVFALAAGEQNLGLDIQRLAQVRQMRIPQISRRCFTEKEQEWIFAGGGTGATAMASPASVDTTRDGALADDEAKQVPAEAARRFCRLWTRKEAWAKYTGEGLEGVMKKECILHRDDVYFAEFTLDEEILGCLCTGGKAHGIQISR